jgi:hypothetical protein
MKRAIWPVLRLALILAQAWLVLSASLFALMYLPPETFSRIVSYLPRVSMMALPFRPLWLIARRGSLRIGDQAPDFELRREDSKGSVRLTANRGQRPVVLIFGSYT